MSKKIVAFGASNSKNSINKKLATFAANQVEDAAVTILDLNDFEMPIYGIDKENESGFPALAEEFKTHLKNSDGIVISFAEHNGAYSAAFKNIMDWLSRMEGSTWEDKPMFLLATSPGGRGGQTVLDIAFNKFQRMNKNKITHFSLPSFFQNFSEETGITDEELLKSFSEQLNLFTLATDNKEVNL
ncbi:MAG: NADPH-dependent FMN reductase [Saprospiraceae bacterium]